MSLRWNLGGRPEGGAATEDKEFYAELLRVVSEYLQEYGESRPSKMLRSFLNSQYARHPINGCGIDAGSGLSADRIFMNGLCEEISNNNKATETGNTSARYFTEEIRHLILKTILRTESPEEKHILIEKHTWIHLLELHFMSDISTFEKMNKFLNTNFRLSDDDFIGHACRRNFSEIIRMQPALEHPIEDLIQILDSEPMKNEPGSPGPKSAIFSETKPRDNTGQLEKWKAQYDISEEFYTVVSGNHAQFSNIYETCCYDLAYRGTSKASNPYLDVLNGSFQDLLSRSSGWMHLVISLASTEGPNLRELELIFESIFYEVLNVDHLTALGFLAYSRAVEYHFSLFVTKLPLNSIAVDSLVCFSKRAGISPLQVVERYAYQLQSENRYDELCRCIVNYSLTGFGYSEEAILYFIKNFRRYEAFTEEPFFSDDTNKFIYWVHRAPEADCQMLTFLMRNPYSHLALEEIIGCVLGHPQLDEAFLIMALNCIVNSKAEKAVVNELKARVVKQLAKEVV